MKSPRGAWPGVLTLAILALGVGIGTGSTVSVRAGYVLLALLIACAMYGRLSRSALLVDYRVAASHVSVGERLLEVFAVRSMIPWPVIYLDVTGHAGVAGVPQRWTISLGPRGHEEWTLVVTAPRRGRFEVGVAYIDVRDPFGLTTWRRRLAAVGEVVVRPRPRMVPGFTLAAARAGELMPARRSWARMPVSGTVRPFDQGDSSTRIHWLSSARHGELMVKDSDRSVGQRVWVGLDLCDESHYGSGDDSTVEYGVEAAAFVVELAFKAGLEVGLIVAGDGPAVVEPGRGRDQRDDLLDLLAVAREGPGDSLAAIVDSCRVARPSDAVIVVTPAVRPDLLNLCARLSRLGCGVAAVLLDPASFGGRDTPYAAVLEAERIPVFWLRRAGTGSVGAIK